MSGSPFPTVYIGGDPGPGDADRVAVDAALHATIAIYNELPGHLMGRYVASVVLSLCMSANDPAAELIGLHKMVAGRIAMMQMQMKPEGSA